MEKIKTYLQSVYCIPVLLFIALICFSVNQVPIIVFTWAAYVFAVLVICPDKKNIFPIFILIPNFISNVYEQIFLKYYIVCVALVILGVFYVFISTIIIKKKSVNLGKMFYPILIADVGFMLAGVIGHFNIYQFLAVVGFCIILYPLYFIALNNTKNLKETVLLYLIFGAVAIALLIFTQNLFFGGETGIFHGRKNTWIGALNINESAIYVMSGMISAAFLSAKRKYGFCLLALSLFLYFTIIVMCSRCIMAISTVVLISIISYVIIVSDNKLSYALTLIGAIVLAVIFYFAMKPTMDSAIEELKIRVLKGNLTGRDVIWKDCIERFKERKLFGWGYLMTPNNTVAENSDTIIVFAHNTFIQWITCLGIIGSILVVPYYVMKYYIVFNGKKLVKLPFIVLIICIELSGMLDSAASMSVFVYILNYLILATVENTSSKYDNK
ncbi:MAG: O-antigen ligase family protein [Clostridia bacterium]|nr:O-antigen ligase family protein [Clostridia bacterium]